MKLIEVTREFDVDGNSIAKGYYEVLDVRDGINIEVEGRDYFGYGVKVDTPGEGHWWIPLDTDYVWWEWDTSIKKKIDKQLCFEFST